MPIPDYQSLMLPVLVKSSEGEVRIGDVVDRLAVDLKLNDDELAELIPSGKQTTFSNRVHWAKSYLKQAGLVEATKRAHFQITPRGIEILQSDVRSIEILERLLLASAAFFESVVVKLLVAMGYGGTFAEAGKAIGRSGDDGVDGVIDQDTLGLDRVYVQAKRYKSDNIVGPAAIREFFGSLDMKKASKGVFVTTSSFSAAAKSTAEQLGKRIVLIDGTALASLMIRFNVGCRIAEVYELRKIDEEFFEYQ